MNVGIIGLGVQGRIRLGTLRGWGAPYRITRVCDTVLPADLDIGDARFTTRCMDIIQDPDVDVIFICTPNHLTCSLVVASLDSGKHVFSEKPPGRNTAEAESMLAAAERNPHVRLMFGFNHRHHESIVKIKEVIDSGDLGEVLWMRGRYGKSVAPEFSNTWRAKREFAGGGILLDQGIHMLDLFLYIVGDFTEVKAFVSKLFWKLDVEDNVFALFRNERGQVASLHSTMTQWRHLFSFEVFLTQGHIVLNGLLTSSNSYGQEEELSIARNKFFTGPAVAWTDEEKVVYNVNTSWEREMRLFFDCVESGRQVPLGNARDAVKLMRLVDRVYAEGATAEGVRAF